MDRKQFEKWFKTTDAYKLLEEQNYFKVDLLTFKEHRNQYQHTSVQIAYMTWQHQQAKVDELQKQFDQHDKLLHQRNKDVEELYDINEKHAAEKAELQKRVDAAELKLKEITNIAMRARRGEYYTESGRNAGLNIAAQLEQALKGEGQ
ncbi:hypothetical protein [Acinetobacter baumannii]|uniref:hypothetical protein n=1 Tax=Acinetobacter baumannii TaxID=470 RepID=UPI003C71619F